MMTERPRHANVALFVPHEGCPHRCRFCNQRVIAGQTLPLTPAQVTAACERALETLPDGVTAQIAFFGGSFTAIDRAEMERLLQAAQPFLRTRRFDGIRCSTRPDAVDDEVLMVLKSYGVTAVELGTQSMDDSVLQRCERGHTAADVVRASACIRRQGLSLGLQMMTGLPGDTDDGAWHTAQQLAALFPDTMRIYPTVVLRGTALAEDFAAGRYQPPTLEETVSLCARLLTFFEQEKGIPVIRLGLHDSEELKTQRLAGAYHPALRELCEGQMYVNTALSVLTRVYPDAAKPVTVTLAVSPKAVSRMVGQHRQNLRLLYEQGYDVQVKADDSVPLWEVRVKQEFQNR